MESSTTERITERIAVFLDLQGTLGGEGLGDILDFAFFPCAIPALRLLNESGLLAIVLTNQSHIAKGYFTWAQYEERIAQLQQELHQEGVRLDAVYCCPHRQSDNCGCQKPKLGLVEEARRTFEIDLLKSYVVGDMGASDMLLAHAAGCKGILVRTGAGESSLAQFRQGWAQMEPDFIATDVLQAVEWIQEDQRHRCLTRE